MFRALKSLQRKVQSCIAIITITGKLKRNQKENKKSRREKFKVSKACRSLLVLYLLSCEATPQVGIYREKQVTRLNLLTSHLLVKVGFLDSNLLRTFGGSNEVTFGRSLACLKALEVRYNFLRYSIRQKMHQVFVIPKIPLGGQNCQK